MLLADDEEETKGESSGSSSGSDDDQTVKDEPAGGCSISESKPELEVKKKLKRKPKYKQKKLVMNVAQTKYHVVKYVAKKIFQMRLTA